MMKHPIRIAMMIPALFVLLFALAGSAWAEEPIEIPLRAQQTFQHKLHTFLASKKKARKQLNNVGAEDVKRLRAFHEAGSTEERNAAARAMDRAMLIKISRLTQALGEYNVSIKGLRKALINMANLASRVRKTHASLTSGQFNQTMVAYEPIARELARINLGRVAANLHSLATQLANKHRIRMANRNRFSRNSATGGNTTGMISDLTEDLQASEEQLMALAGTLKEMVRGIQQAHMSQNIRYMRGKLERVQNLGEGLTSTYLGGYGEVLDHMTSSGKATNASARIDASYEGQAFPRLSQVHSPESGENR